MRKINTSSITSTVAMPFKSGTIDHLQKAYTEAVAALAKNMIGTDYDPTKFYILHGCVNSGSGSSYVISAGAIFYNGEVYLVDAATFTASGSTAVGTITKTQEVTNADPVTFTDGVSRNVHDIYKIVFAAGTSGSGDVDFADLVGLVASVDSWHNVGDVGEPSFFTTWANQSGANQPLQFKKNADGTVTIRGIVSVNAGSGAVANKNVFELPAGYRHPSRDITMFVNITGVGVANITIIQDGGFEAGYVAVVLPGATTYTYIIIPELTFHIS